MNTNLCAILMAGTTLSITTGAQGQPRDLPQYEFEFKIDTGPIINLSQNLECIYMELVSEPGADWIRLKFDEIVLGADNDLRSSYLRIVSIEDGAVQYLDNISVSQWRYTSAYFNGDAVFIELWAFPESGINSLTMSRAIAGEPARHDPRLEETLCTTLDDRVLSSDNRLARVLPSLCTAWMLDDCESCFVTAGHCNANGSISADVLEFNVPLSNGSCSEGGINHPHPDHQYVTDPDSQQTSGDAGNNGDWGYFGVFPNSNTGLHPSQAYGGSFSLDISGVPTGTARVTGYGLVLPPVGMNDPPCEWYRVQKTSTGTFGSINGVTLDFRVSITPGNSGSPVIIDGTSDVVGIVWGSGCSANPVTHNEATWVGFADLQNALASPLGVCATPAGPDYSFPNGLPDLIDMDGQVLNLAITQNGSLVPIPSSATISYNDGSGPVTLPLTYLGGTSYLASLPGGDCFTDIDFWFNIDTVDGKNYRHPSGSNYNSVVAESFISTADHDFETDPGWTTSGIASAGQWVRATPGNFGRNDPPSDGDGSGKCFVTGSNPNEDLDGGPVYLTSVNYNLSQKLRSEVLYYVWHETNDPENDLLTVEISDDGGTNWVTIETISNTVGWEERRYKVRDYVNITSTVVIRFSSVDSGSSITESAIDGFRIGTFICVEGCLADTNNDGVLDPSDYTAWLSAWNAGDPKGDQNLDGKYDNTDFSAWLANQGAGCP